MKTFLIGLVLLCGCSSRPTIPDFFFLSQEVKENPWLLTLGALYQVSPTDSSEVRKIVIQEAVKFSRYRLCLKAGLPYTECVKLFDANRKTADYY